MKKEIIVIGGDEWLAIDPKYTNEQILNYIRSQYGWEDVHFDRKPHLVLVQPKAKGIANVRRASY